LQRGLSPGSRYCPRTDCPRRPLPTRWWPVPGEMPGCNAAFHRGAVTAHAARPLPTRWWPVPGEKPGCNAAFHRGAVAAHALTAHAGHCPRVGRPSPVRCRIATRPFTGELLLPTPPGHCPRVGGPSPVRCRIAKRPFTGEPLLPTHELPTRPDCKTRALPQ